MIRHHRISGEMFAALAAGLGGPLAVGALRDAQLSRHLLLLKYIVSEWPGDRAGRDDAVAVLTDAQTRAPDAVADLLADPMVGAWATRTARRIRGSATADVPLPVELAHLGAVATAAALAADLPAELGGHVRGGLVAVPTRGGARIALPDHAPVRLRVRSGALEVSANGARVAAPNPDVDTGGWWELRRLAAETAGRRAEVALEDLDPYRDHHHIPAAGRLPERHLPRWREMYAGAWELLVRYAPDRADELAAGLRSVVPLAAAGPGPARSATARDAFGTFGLTPPESAADFAVTLVHEFQHSKLSALLDLVPLYEATADDRYFAPWRLDPRPIGGLLQGVYAFLGVTDLWRQLRAAPDLGDLAEREFAVIREQVRHALGELRGSPALTAQGRRFAAGLGATTDALMAESLPAPVVREARTALARNHEAWLARNGY